MLIGVSIYHSFSLEPSRTYKWRKRFEKGWFGRGRPRKQLTKKRSREAGKRGTGGGRDTRNNYTTGAGLEGPGGL